MGHDRLKAAGIELCLRFAIVNRVHDAVKAAPKVGMTLDQFVKEWRANVAVNLKGSTTRASRRNQCSACRRCNSGCDAKAATHSDPRITLGVYAHVIGNQQRDAVENRSARIEQYAVN